MMKGKKWKRLVMGVTAVLAAGLIAGCGGGGGQKKAEDGKKMYKIGIVQLVAIESPAVRIGSAP